MSADPTISDRGQHLASDLTDSAPAAARTENKNEDKLYRENNYPKLPSTTSSESGESTKLPSDPPSYPGSSTSGLKRNESFNSAMVEENPTPRRGYRYPDPTLPIGHDRLHEERINYELKPRPRDEWDFDESLKRFQLVSEWLVSLFFDLILLFAEVGVNLWLALMLKDRSYQGFHDGIVTLLFVPSFVNALLWLKLKSRYRQIGSGFMFVVVFLGFPSPAFV